MNAMVSPIIATEGLTKDYGETRVLDGVDVEIGAGSLVVIQGESGSGKSTLLNCMATTEPLTEGRVLFEDIDVSGMKPREQARWRAEHTGFVFQESALLGGLSVAKNIELVRRSNGNSIDPEFAYTVSKVLGIEDLLLRSPGELSGGQQQRVSIARAVVHRPDIIFADEPTASLDRYNREQVYGIFKQIVEGLGTTVVIVAHDEFATSPGFADRSLHMQDGRLNHTA